MARKKISNPHVFDAVVAGGGLAGLTVAVRLGQTGMQVAVIEREEESRLTSSAFDGRTTAIAYGSKLILEECGVWALLAGDACPIDDIRVADQRSTRTLDFESEKLGDNPFGYIVDNVFFRQALFARVKSLPNITLFCGTAIEAIDSQTARVQLGLSNGKTVETPLLVAADGRKSFCREAAGIKVRSWSYRQSALVAVIGHEKPHHNLAIENFYPDGPFALLPMTGNRSSLVWSERPGTAETLLNLPEQEFLDQVAARGCDYLGKLHLASKRMLYPLNFVLADDLWKGRIVLIGEAAHGMHPIAGQGLNLSLRDVAVLGDMIENARRVGSDHGAPDLLSRFAGKRHLDHFTFMIATDIIEKLFSNNIPPVRWARRFGLGVVQRLPFAKNFFGRMAMGLLSH